MALFFFFRLHCPFENNKINSKFAKSLSIKKDIPEDFELTPWSFPKV
jgi:hypothetical protein